MKANIIRHPGFPGFHIDDQVATAIAVATFYNLGCKVDILEIHPSETTLLSKYQRHDGSMVVDVGRVYNPGQLCFDHHHDATLPCAAVLVASHFGLASFARSDAGLFMTIKDLKGIQEAILETGHTPEKSPDEGILVNVDLSDPGVCNCWLDVLAAVRKDTTYSELLALLVSATNAMAYSEAMQRIFDRGREEEKIINSAAIYDISGICVAVPSRPVRPLPFFQRGGDLVISPEYRDFFQATKNQQSEKGKLLNFWKSSEPLNFLHNSGHTCSLHIGPKRNREWVAEFVKSVVRDGP